MIGKNGENIGERRKSFLEGEHFQEKKWELNRRINNYVTLRFTASIEILTLVTSQQVIVSMNLVSMLRV